MPCSASHLRIELSYFIGDRTLYPGPLFANLELFAEAAVLSPSHPWFPTLHNFLDRHGPSFKNTPLKQIREILITDFKSTDKQADFIKHHMLWNQFIDCDLSEHLNESLPPPNGGFALKQAIRNSIKGTDYEY